MSTYTALSGDLVQSRAGTNRSRLGTKIRQQLARLAELHASQLLAPPTLTRGIDEFSAVFAKPAPAFDFLIALNEALRPQRFRLGIGTGTIDVARRSRNAALMDGPAFHHAAAALKRARDEKRNLAIHAPEVPTAITDTIEALAACHQALTLPHSDAQAMAVRALRTHTTAVAAAESLSISPQAVSQARRRSHFDLLMEIERAARSLFMTYFPGAKLRGTRRRRPNLDQPA